MKSSLQKLIEKLIPLYVFISFLFPSYRTGRTIRANRLSQPYYRSAKLYWGNTSIDGIALFIYFLISAYLIYFILKFILKSNGYEKVSLKNIFNFYNKISLLEGLNIFFLIVALRITGFFPEYFLADILEDFFW